MRNNKNHRRVAGRVVWRVAAIATGVAAIFALMTGVSSATKRSPARASAAKSSASLKTAEAAVRAAEKPIRFAPPTPSFSIAKDKGKTVWYIAPDLSLPFIQQIASGVKAGAAAAGMKSVIFDGKGQVNTFNQGLSEAIAQKAGGIILQGINPSLVSGPLAQAKSAGIPVVDSLNGNPNQALTDGIRAHVTVNYTQGGRLMADWVATQSHGHGQIVVFTSSIYLIYQNMLAGFKSELKRVCPGCKIDAVENVEPTDVATKLGSITSTVLQRYPHAKYFVPFYDGLVTYMTPSIREAHASVQIISHDGVAANLALVRKGQIEVADVSNPPNPSMGWSEVDELGRIMAGKKPVAEQLPQQLFVQRTVAANPAKLFPGYNSFQSKLKHVWGL